MDDQVLTELERKLINWTESKWFLEGVLPTPEQLRDKFDLGPKQLMAILNKEIVVKSFQGRGMPVIEGRTLTPEQITAINTILNTTDTRSEKKKLQDMNISAVQWNGWKQSKQFKEYYRARVEKIFGDALPDVHMALRERAVNGDLGALKFYYEITGHYRGNEAGVDIRMIIERVFEIISLRVKDADTLSAIAGDLLKLAGVDSVSSISNEPPVAGTVVPNKLEL